MSDIYRVNNNLPAMEKTELLNEMLLSLEGKIASSEFNINEIEQIVSDFSIDRKYLRNQTLGHTISTYTGWSHVHAESGYSIWKFPPTNYTYNSVNQLYLDDRVLDFRGLAGSETALIYNLVYMYDSTLTTYNNYTSEAGTEAGTQFSLMNETTDYLYLGDANTFGGVKLELYTRGSNYTLKVEYFNGSWIELTANTNNLVDNTNNFASDGYISWTIPTDWSTNAVNAQTYYWIRISTTTIPVTVAESYYTIPYNSVISLLAMSSEQILAEEWAWCSFGSRVYVTIRNTGATAYEGDYYITSSSTATNKQNYFIYNHEIKGDYEDSTYTIAGQTSITLDQLVDVDVHSGLTNGQIISWNSARGLWVNTTNAAGSSNHASLSNLTYASSGHTGFSASTHTHAFDDLSDVAIGSGGPLANQILRYTTAYGWHNWTPTYVNVATAVRGDLITGQGTSPIWQRLALGTVGNILRSNGTDLLYSTATYPDTGTAYRLPVFSATNVMTELAAVGATGEYLKGNTGAIPSWATLNQAAISGLTTAASPVFVAINLTADTNQIVLNSDGGVAAITLTGTATGSAKTITFPDFTGTVYVSSGTDVAVADGGTGKSVWTQYLIPYADTTTSFSQIAIGTNGQVLTSRGAGLAPTFQTVTTGASTLDALTDVMVSSGLVNEQVLFWDAGDAIWRNSSIQSLTTRVTTIVSNATPTINTDNCDAVTITALASNINTMTTNLSGTAINFQKLVFRIKDNGTARSISWGNKFSSNEVSLPTTTVASTVLIVGFIYNTVTATWGCIANSSITGSSSGTLDDLTNVMVSSGLVNGQVLSWDSGDVMWRNINLTLDYISDVVVNSGIVEGDILTWDAGDAIWRNRTPSYVRVNTVTSHATPSINTNTTDMFTITALAGDITSMTTNLTGTPTNGQKLTIRITGTAARAITWGSKFRASTDLALPTTTTTTKTLYCGFIYNINAIVWDLVAKLDNF